jgi:hypothetical protein
MGLIDGISPGGSLAVSCLALNLMLCRPSLLSVLYHLVTHAIQNSGH